MGRPRNPEPEIEGSRRDRQRIDPALHKPDGRRPIWTDETCTTLGEEMIEFVSRPGVWHLCEFTAFKKKTQHWLNAIAASNEVFSEYLVRAREILGHKLFKQAVEKNCSTFVVTRWMPVWLSDRKMILEQMKEEATVKAEAMKEVMLEEPNHPFWKTFTDFIDAKDPKEK